MEKNLFISGSIGRKIERMRKIKGVSQEELSLKIGMSRQWLSKVEQSDTIEDDKLNVIANALGVTAEIIKNIIDDQIIFHIQNMNDNAQAIYQYNFNPVDKLVEVFEDNKRLYEALLNSEREKNELLQQLIKKES